MWDWNQKGGGWIAWSLLSKMNKLKYLTLPRLPMEKRKDINYSLFLSNIWFINEVTRDENEEKN
jgi:hypothetical protein